MVIDKELFKKSSPVVFQTSIMNKAMGWRQEGEAGSLTHKTCCYLDLDLKTSEMFEAAKGQTISQQWHLRKISSRMRPLSIAMEVTGKISTE